ncbi:MAG TPA: TetR-like C-terminal domain-containing protein, partial [Ilumatobacteraceae bacterium]
LSHYLLEVGRIVAMPQARAVIGTLIAEAAHDPELAASLYDRLVTPRRQPMIDRVTRAIEAGQLAPTTDAGALADMIVGPVYFRALMTREVVDEQFVGELLSAVGAANRA